MEVTIDSRGRMLVPKEVRDFLGLTPGSRVTISVCGSSVYIMPCSRTARLEREASGRLVSRAETVVTDEQMFALIDAGRR